MAHLPCGSVGEQLGLGSAGWLLSHSEVSLAMTIGHRAELPRGLMVVLALVGLGFLHDFFPHGLRPLLYLVSPLPGSWQKEE